ncbi:Ribose-phosphate pyrophosphokinase [Candidatus Tremblaya princeps]|uniref:ribose-phosphate diphosphokinase n=2 Tax=Tremblaya princeps TaxID=189385 RepID=A0A143WPI4_TREPR|nr:Ribose-phosphate pyrophosphokinase [Candidatus Tremblaya princeps]
MPTLLPGTGKIGLAHRRSRHCGIRVGLMECWRYADGERCLDIAEKVRHEDLLLLNTLCSPVNSIELILARASCVTLVPPYIAYGRQEKHAQGTRATLAKNCLASVLSRSIVEIDLYSSQRHVFFYVPTQPLCMLHAAYRLSPGCTARVSPDDVLAMAAVTDTIHHDPRDLGTSARVLASACVIASAIGSRLPFMLTC